MKSPRKKLLFLYNELAGYFLACIDTLSMLYDVDIHIVRYPLNPVAPFEFKFNDHVKYYERKNYNRTQLIALAKEINPDFIYTGGWMDKDYIAVSKSFKNTPVVLTSDMPWLGTARQKVDPCSDLYICHGYLLIAGYRVSPMLFMQESLGSKATDY